MIIDSTYSQLWLTLTIIKSWCSFYRRVTGNKLARKRFAPLGSPVPSRPSPLDFVVRHKLLKAEFRRATSLRLFCNYCVVVLSAEPVIRGQQSYSQLVLGLSVHPTTGRRQLRQGKRCRWRVVGLWSGCGSLVFGQ